MVTKRSLFVKFQNISVLLHVEDLEYDPVSSTVYIIDPKEGVHMFKLMAE